VQAVDAPDPVGAALTAISETLGTHAIGFFTFNPADNTISMTPRDAPRGDRARGDRAPSPG